MERECDLNSSMEKNKNQNDMNGYEYVKKKKLLNGLTIAKWLNHEKEQIKSQKELPLFKHTSDTIPYAP